MSSAKQKNSTAAEQALSALSAAAAERKFEYFHDSQNRAWASIPVRDHVETYAIRSREFRLLIQKVIYEKLGSAPKKLVADCIEHLETVAVCGAPNREVFVRVATMDDAVYLDLANDDWQTVEIRASGWRIANTPPVKFRRTQGLGALPFPKDGRKLQDLIEFFTISNLEWGCGASVAVSLRLAPINPPCIVRRISTSKFISRSLFA